MSSSSQNNDTSDDSATTISFMTGSRGDSTRLLRIVAATLPENLQELFQLVEIMLEALQDPSTIVKCTADDDDDDSGNNNTVKEWMGLLEKAQQVMLDDDDTIDSIACQAPTLVAQHCSDNRNPNIELVTVPQRYHDAKTLAVGDLANEIRRKLKDVSRDSLEQNVQELHQHCTVMWTAMQEAGVNNWWGVKYCLDELDAGDYKKATGSLLSIYGGMGSFSDFYLMESSVNFGHSQDRAYTLAAEIQIKVALQKALEAKNK